MRKLRLIWVTSRMHIEIYKYPAWWVQDLYIAVYSSLLHSDFIDLKAWFFLKGVMLWRLKHGAKEKEGLAPGVIGFSRIWLLVLWLAELLGEWLYSHDLVILFCNCNSYLQKVVQGTDKVHCYSDMNKEVRMAHIYLKSLICPTFSILWYYIELWFL